MVVGLGKQITIVELFKAGKSQKEICKDLKVNRMLVWRTFKRYKESGNVQNRPAMADQCVDTYSQKRDKKCTNYDGISLLSPLIRAM